MHSQGNRGFTLIELIVALTVMMMVMTVAFAAFRTGLNAWERGTKAAERLERRSVVERLIRRQLPLAMRGNIFQGKRDRLEFVADYSLVDGSGDFRKIEYAVEQGRFLYAEDPLHEFVEGEPAERRFAALTAVTAPTVLAELKGISFEFLGADDKQMPAWVEEWDSADGVPPAVRVRLDDDNFVLQMVNRK
jgi:prepilin-type N-terminal cleavage/methylation domain-containing protein